MGGNNNFTLIFSKDTYSQVLPVDSSDVACDPPAINQTTCNGGVARRATEINELRGNFTNTLLVDGGAFFQGNPALIREFLNNPSYSKGDVFFYIYMGTELSYYYSVMGNTSPRVPTTTLIRFHQAIKQLI